MGAHIMGAWLPECWYLIFSA